MVTYISHIFIKSLLKSGGIRDFIFEFNRDYDKSFDIKDFQNYLVSTIKEAHPPLLGHIVFYPTTFIDKFNTNFATFKDVWPKDEKWEKYKRYFFFYFTVEFYFKILPILTETIDPCKILFDTLEKNKRKQDFINEFDNKNIQNENDLRNYFYKKIEQERFNPFFNFKDDIGFNSFNDFSISYYDISHSVEKNLFMEFLRSGYAGLSFIWSFSDIDFDVWLDLDRLFIKRLYEECNNILNRVMYNKMSTF